MNAEVPTKVGIHAWGWISFVSDPPPEGEEILVYDPELCDVYMRSLVEHRDFEQLVWVKEDGSVDVACEPSHWMRKPCEPMLDLKNFVVPDRESAADVLRYLRKIFGTNKIVEFLHSLR